MGRGPAAQRSSVMAEGRGHVVPEDERAGPRQVAALPRRPVAVQAAAAQTLRRGPRGQLPLHVAYGVLVDGTSASDCVHDTL